MSPLAWLTVALAADPACPERAATVAGVVAGDALVEASGMVASGRDPALLWAHNDSGNAPELVAVSTDGQVRATVAIAAEAVDWEDIARHGPRLIIADIGDNRAQRATVTLWTVAEPDPSGSPPAAPLPATRRTLRYADGPRDSEVLLVHPTSGETLIISKGREDEHAIYAVPDEGEQMARVGSLPFLPGTPYRTAGDVAPDGSAVVLRGYTFGWWYPVQPGQTLLEALQGAPCPFPLAPEVQGEAVALTADGTVYTLSEGGDQPLWRYDP